MDRKELSQLILRIGLSLVFLYFGFSQIYGPDNWTGFVPEFITGTALTAANVVMLNGILEIVLGIFLIMGLYVRFASFILALHLLGISFSIGLSPTAIRDFGLAIATFCVFLNGAGKYCLDNKFQK